MFFPLGKRKGTPWAGGSGHACLFFCLFVVCDPPKRKRHDSSCSKRGRGPSRRCRSSWQRRSRLRWCVVLVASESNGDRPGEGGEYPCLCVCVWWLRPPGGRTAPAQDLSGQFFKASGERHVRGEYLCPREAPWLRCTVAVRYKAATGAVLRNCDPLPACLPASAPCAPPRRAACSPACPALPRSIGRRQRPKCSALGPAAAARSVRRHLPRRPAPRPIRPSLSSEPRQLPELRPVFFGETSTHIQRPMIDIFTPNTDVPPLAASPHLTPPTSHG
jgi:hypothetical protein|uniref:Uncharacterized protein n=1 Tax=Zea mays TaxID=4577 RepID=A0A804LFN1_MAIZE